MKISRLARIFLSHVLLLTLISVMPLYLVESSLIGETSNYSKNLWYLFLTIFGCGGLSFGGGGVLRSGILVGKYLIKNDDFNSTSVRHEIENLIFSVGEILVSLIALSISPFVTIIHFGAGV